MWGHYLFMTTPDNYLVSLDARTGAERWHKTIAELSQQYFTTVAPMVVENQVLVSPGQRSGCARHSCVFRSGDR